EERPGAGLDGRGLAERVVAEGLLDAPGAVVFGGQDRQRGVGVPLGAVGDRAVLEGGYLVTAGVVVVGAGGAADGGGGDLPGQVVGVGVGALLGLVALGVVAVGGGRGGGGGGGERVGRVVSVAGGGGAEGGGQAVADLVVGVGRGTARGAAVDPGRRKAGGDEPACGVVGEVVAGRADVGAGDVDVGGQAR